MDGVNLGGDYGGLRQHDSRNALPCADQVGELIHEKPANRVIGEGMSVRVSCACVLATSDGTYRRQPSRSACPHRHARSSFISFSDSSDVTTTCARVHVPRTMPRKGVAEANLTCICKAPNHLKPPLNSVARQRMLGPRGRHPMTADDARRRLT